LRVRHGTPIVTKTKGLRDIARREAERRALLEVCAATSRLFKISYKTLLTKIAECELSLFADRGAEARIVEGDGPAPTRLAAIVITADDLTRISVHTVLTNLFTLTADLYAPTVAKIPISRLSQNRHEMCRRFTWWLLCVACLAGEGLQ